MQKFKMATKVGEKQFLEKVAGRLCKYPVGQKCHRNRSITLRFQDKWIFAFYAEIQDGRQKWREKVLLQKVASRLCRYPVGQKFRRNLSILLSETLFLVLRKFKMAAKSGGKTIFGKSRQ